MKNHRRQAGFTLIELIAVIVILGILAAVALPRFADMSGDARRSQVNGGFGAVRSASSIVHSAWLAGGGVAGANVTLEGNVIGTVNGYPSAANIVAAAGLQGFNVAVANGVATISADANHTAATGCGFTYTEAVAGAAPVIVLSADPLTC